MILNLEGSHYMEDNFEHHIEEEIRFRKEKARYYGVPEHKHEHKHSPRRHEEEEKKLRSKDPSSSRRDKNYDFNTFISKGISTVFSLEICSTEMN